MTREDAVNQEERLGGNSTIPVVEVIIASNYSKESGEELCVVCLSEFMEGDEVRVLPECSHVFHVGCIDKWLTNHCNCPLCRADTLSATATPVEVVPASDMSV